VRPRGVPAELYSAWLYIAVLGILVWWPFVALVAGHTTPLGLFHGLREVGAAAMFTTGAVIANATSVGGGIIFNPTLQLVFGVGGISALTLSILVQCAGMASGTYGWYRWGAFQHVHQPHLTAMALVTAAATAVWTIAFLLIRPIIPEVLPLVMKTASMLISFYVGYLVLREAREPVGLAQIEEPLVIDRRIWLWIVLGTGLNVTTAVGAGELVFAHLIKYYRASPKIAVAVGTMAQAVSVITQGIFLVIFMRQYILIPMVCIGVFFCMVGGRLAPIIMTRPAVEPYAKYILAFTAIGMGLTSGWMLFR